MDFVTFTKEIVNGKLHFVYSEKVILPPMSRVPIRCAYSTAFIYIVQHSICHVLLELSEQLQMSYPLQKFIITKGAFRTILNIYDEAFSWKMVMRCGSINPS